MDRNVEDFLSYVDSFRHEAKNITFSYFAVRRGKNFYIVNSRLFYNNFDINQKSSHFLSDRIKAGLYTLENLNLNPRGLIVQALSGVVSTPHGDLIFEPNESGEYKFNYDRFHNEGLRNQYRLNVLSIKGYNCAGIVQQPEFDWEVKSNETPYGNIIDLLSNYRLQTDVPESSTLEIVAFNVVDIDTRSRVVDGVARVTIRLFAGLSPEKASLGFRIARQGTTLERSRIRGAELKWETVDNIQLGRYDIPVPEGAIVQCFANFDNLTHHFYWIVDDKVSQNTRRSVYEIFDEGLKALEEFLEKGPGKGNARDLEAGVAWLLWMLGFSVIHLGGSPKTQNAADLVAVSPGGNYAVIECTTGTLRVENKLPLLIMRSNLVKEQLIKSGSGHVKVLPIIVTSRTKQEVAADIQHAEGLGVCVFTQENLREGISQTYIPSDAEQLFIDAFEQAESRRTRDNIADDVKSAV